LTQVSFRFERSCFNVSNLWLHLFTSFAEAALFFAVLIYIVCLFVSKRADAEPSSDSDSTGSPPSKQGTVNSSTAVRPPAATVTAPSTVSVAPSTPAHVAVETVYVARKRVTRPSHDYSADATWRFTAEEISLVLAGTAFQEGTLKIN
jgi:hypothetical protein